MRKSTDKEQRLATPWCIGVDVGGTFTDLVLIDAEQRVISHKTLTVPNDPAAGVLHAVHETARKLQIPERELLTGCRQFIHGSTIATNTILERTGAKVGLLTSKGFRDALEIRRGLRDNMWEHRVPWSDVLVPRRLRLPIGERTDKDGKVLAPVDPKSVADAAQTLERMGVDAVVIAFLHSYANIENEHACRDQLATLLPDVRIICSSDIAPIMGEYERTSTAIIDAYVGPKVVPYLERLDAVLSTKGLPHQMLIMQSNGGVLPLAQVKAKPIVLALSGPAAGVGSLKFVSQVIESNNLISIEVGGTSCDVAVLHEGRIGETDQLKIGDLLMLLPCVDLHTISAGGGTIAGVDDGGMLYAGPRGAGAKPGPACYGLSGSDPTVTDAQLLLGRLAPGPYAGGAIELQPTPAADATQRVIAEPLSISIDRAAIGIIELVEQHVKHAIEEVSIHRGLDVRDFTIVGAGGAGGMHAAPVARALGCAKAYIPRNAGVFCAFGMCNSNIRHDFVRTINKELNNSAIDTLKRVFRELENDARDQLRHEGFRAQETLIEQALDLVYVGQQWSVRVTLIENRLDESDIRTRFEAEFRRLFDYIQPDGRIEIVNARATGIGQMPALNITALKPTTEPLPEPRIRSVYINSQTGVENAAIFSGPDLMPGHKVQGPAIVEEETTTILVGADDILEVDPYGNFLIHVGLNGESARAD